LESAGCWPGLADDAGSPSSPGRRQDCGVSYSDAGLSDDDADADVRNDFREFVADGLTAEAAMNAFIQQWGSALGDHDEACAFWLALDDTKWKVGRLEDRVRG
jgi:hypothetical protein